MDRSSIQLPFEPAAARLSTLSGGVSCGSCPRDLSYDTVYRACVSDVAPRGPRRAELLYSR